MRRHLYFFCLVGLAGLFLAPAPGRAQDTALTAEQLSHLDQWGWLTPDFKRAVHDLVETKQAIVATKAEEKKLAQELPDLQKQATDAQAKVAALRQELAEYDRTDEFDFTQLQKAMSDPGAKPEEQRVLAQAYVWTYATSPHLAEAQQDLQQVQKKIADQLQAAKDAEAARVAARAKLIQRAQAHDLSLAEWRDFLRDMSQEDLLKYLGAPQTQQPDYWIYAGSWTEDPVTHQKVGIQVTFNAGRVISVAEGPP
jgi:hypothetical protein